jgi:hypothetical protein
VIKNLHRPVSSMLKLDWACRRRTQALQATRRFTVSMLAVSLALIASSAGWAGNSRVEFRVYDPTGVVHTEVTGSDVVRSSVHAVRVSGSVHLYVGLTKTGASKFQTLTRALARRGARLHRPQSLAVAIDGHVYWRPSVDYKLFPNGIPGSSGLDMQVLRLAVAQRLAKLIRSA